MAAPTPGWGVGVDRVVEAFKQRDIFVTIQPPDPTYLYAQVIVEQRVMTNVPGDIAARLFARVLSSDPKKPTNPPFSLVAMVAPVAPADADAAAK